MTSRRASTTLLGQLGAAAVAALILFWFLQVRSVPDTVLSRRECERAYQQARTALDTIAADSLEPRMQRRERGGAAINCRAMTVGRH